MPSFFVLSCATSEQKFSSEEEELLDTAQKFYQKSLYVEALHHAERLIEEYPGGIHIVQAKTLIADTHFKRGDYNIAAESYKALLKLYSPKNPDYIRFQIANSYYKSIPSLYERDLSESKPALHALKIFYLMHPKSSYIKEARKIQTDIARKLALKELSVGSFYLKKKAFSGATRRLLAVYKNQRKFLNASEDKKLLFSLSLSAYKTKNFNLGKKVYIELFQKYSESSEFSRLKFLLDNRI